MGLFGNDNSERANQLMREAQEIINNAVERTQNAELSKIKPCVMSMPPRK